MVNTRRVWWVTRVLFYFLFPKGGGGARNSRTWAETQMRFVPGVEREELFFENRGLFSSSFNVVSFLLCFDNQMGLLGGKRFLGGSVELGYG